jgi:hypothetical protein
MDSDLQHPLWLVDAFVDAWISEGFDVVYAYVAQTGRESVLRRALRKIYYRIINANAEVVVPPNAGDFRLLSRRAYEALRGMGERQRMMKGLYSWIGFRQKGIAFTPDARAYGASKFSFARLSVLAIDGITSFSILPLRLATWTGLLVATLSRLYGLWTVLEKVFYGIAVPGYPTLLTAVVFIGAAQLIFLGIIGEYLGKVLMEVKHRPLFVVESDSVLGQDGAPQ